MIIDSDMWGGNGMGFFPSPFSLSTIVFLRVLVSALRLRHFYSFLLSYSV